MARDPPAGGLVSIAMVSIAMVSMAMVSMAMVSIAMVSMATCRRAGRALCCVTLVLPERARLARTLAPQGSPLLILAILTRARLYGGGALSVTWRDQGWGNRKGHVYARLTAADGNGLYWAFRDNTPSGLTFRDNVQG